MHVDLANETSSNSKIANTVTLVQKNVPYNDRGILEINWKNKKYHTVGTVPTSNRIIMERGKIDKPNTHIYMYDRSLSWLGTGT